MDLEGLGEGVGLLVGSWELVVCRVILGDGDFCSIVVFSDKTRFGFGFAIRL